MNKRKLPIGIQTFRKIREESYYYVDKTAYIHQLLDGSKHYFLSRPRRFGKSLFLDTCKELFEGNEPLFEGLYIHDHWDWSVRHPVLRLDFSDMSFHDPDALRDDVTAQLDAIEAETGATSPYAEAPARFHHLVQTLHERSGQRVAVLVDEYDKPILDALDTPEVARAHRDFLLGLYSVVKGSDAHIHFTLLTGVSKFFTGSLFSGLNNLIDITLDPRYSAICGYTDADLDRVFAPELPGLDRDQIRDWYKGYSWASTSSAAPRGDEKDEGYYASVFYSYFAGLGLNIAVEDSSSHGRLDMAVLFNDYVYLFEFKVVEMASTGAAMTQLKERRYADKYRALGQPIYLIAVEFSKDERNLAAFDVESA